MTEKVLTDCATIKIEELTKPQINFLSYCREFGWGKIEVTVKDGQPVMAKIISQEFKFD